MFQLSREAPKIHLKYPITREAILTVFFTLFCIFVFHDGGHVESNSDSNRSSAHLARLMTPLMNNTQQMMFILGLPEPGRERMLLNISPQRVISYLVPQIG